MVLGAPGAGKSTCLRKMGLEVFKGEFGVFQHQCIPVFIELKQFTGNEINIEDAIAQEFRVCQLPLVEQFTSSPT
jgi:predicted NACHT family NTPase